MEARLPRRSRVQSHELLSSVQLTAPTSNSLSYINEKFSTQHSIGLLGLLPYLQRYGIDQVILDSDYPETQTLNRNHLHPPPQKSDRHKGQKLKLVLPSGMLCFMRQLDKNDLASDESELLPIPGKGEIGRSCYESS